MSNQLQRDKLLDNRAIKKGKFSLTHNFVNANENRGQPQILRRYLHAFNPFLRNQHHDGKDLCSKSLKNKETKIFTNFFSSHHFSQ
jgi:hypothetical protein